MYPNLCWDGTLLYIWADAASNLQTLPNNSCLEIQSQLQLVLWFLVNLVNNAICLQWVKFIIYCKRTTLSSRCSIIASAGWSSKILNFQKRVIERCRVRDQISSGVTSKQYGGIFLSPAVIWFCRLVRSLCWLVRSFCRLVTFIC